MMKKSVFFGLFVASAMTFGSCGGKQPQATAETDSTSVQNLIPRDRTIYGLCLSDSVGDRLNMIADNGDTISLSLAPARAAGKVFGDLKKADRLAVLADKARQAQLVINLNTLLGDWVMPDPIDGSAEIGIRIKEGGVAESIDQSIIIYRTWKINNGNLEIELIREGGGDEQENNTYEILALGADTLCYRTVGAAKDETDTFEYNRWKEKPKTDLGFEFEDTGDEYNKI